MNWLDKLLAKIAVAKAAARSGLKPEHVVTGLLEAFAKISAEPSDTSPPDDPEGRK